MTHAIIKNNINKLLKERNWRVADLEKKVGEIGRRPVKNILSGNSKNPTIETLKSIAHAFKVEVQDLLAEEEELLPINLELLLDVSNTVIQQLKSLENPITFSINIVSLLIKEAYEYSVRLKLTHADKNYIQWILKEHYYKK